MCSNIVDGILKQYEPMEIYLYGSRSRGTHRPDSDYDICVLMPPQWVGNRHDFQLNDTLSKEIGLPVHVVFCTRQNGWCEKKIYPL